MTYQRRIGHLGEQIAAAYLSEHGFQILDYNFTARYGELDLVAREGGQLVFVEVKTRSSLSCGYPETAVSAAKLEKMENAALVWLQKHPDVEDNYRFDLISIRLGSDNVVDDLQHFINVY